MFVAQDSLQASAGVQQRNSKFLKDNFFSVILFTNIITKGALQLLDKGKFFKVWMEAAVDIAAPAVVIMINFVFIIY